MRQLRVGMIGTWGRAHFLKDYLHQPESGESIVVGGADTSDFALEQFGKWAGADAFATRDYRELLERQDIDAVAICTPDGLHEEHTLAALEAGKDVYLEKPMATTTQSCDRILEAIDETGRKCMIGFCLRCSPVMIRAKELIERGVVGEVKAVWIRHFVGYGSDFYYHDWHSLRINCNSLLLHKGSHDIDLMHWLTDSYTRKVAAFGSLDMFGGDKDNELTCDKCPDRSTCTEAQPLVDIHGFEFPRLKCAFRSEIDIEDNHVVIFELANGVKAAYLQCHFTPKSERNYVVIGTCGQLEVDLDQKTILLTERPSNVERNQNVNARQKLYEVGKEGSDRSHGGADPAIVRAFLDYVLRDVPPVASAVDGRMSVAAACAAASSVRGGGVQMIDLPRISSLSGRASSI